jgi:hypothetical protein
LTSPDLLVADDLCSTCGGNGLLIAENQAGFIIDHELSKNSAPTDGKWLKQRLSILEEVTDGKLKGIDPLKRIL